MKADTTDDIRGMGWQSSDKQIQNGNGNDNKQTSHTGKSGNTNISTTFAISKGGKATLVIIALFSALIALLSFLSLFRGGSNNAGITLFFFILSLAGLLLSVRRIKNPAGKANSRYIIGQVRNMKERNEPITDKRSWIVLTFLVENYDDKGNRLQPTAVEMKGFNYSGFLREGDEVQFKRKGTRNKVQYISKLYNLSTETIVDFKRKEAPYLQIANFMGWTLWFIIMLTIFGLIIAYVSNSFF